MVKIYIYKIIEARKCQFETWKKGNGKLLVSLRSKTKKRKKKERENPGDNACNVQTLTYVWIWWPFQTLKIRLRLAQKGNLTHLGIQFHK